MAISIFIAKYFGLYFLIISILCILKHNQFKAVINGFAENPALVMLSGVMTMMLGLFLVLIHTIVVLDWRLLVTVICWLIFIKGWCLLACPKAMISYSKKKAGQKGRMYFITLCYIVVAIVLLCYGFCDQVKMMKVG